MHHLILSHFSYVFQAENRRDISNYVLLTNFQLTPDFFSIDLDTFLYFRYHSVWNAQIVFKKQSECEKFYIKNTQRGPILMDNEIDEKEE